MSNDKNVLYVGSGNSANLVKHLDLSKYTVVCVNNAWKLFTDTGFDVWVHSGDFPDENHPKKKNYRKEVSHREYKESAIAANEMFGYFDPSPEHLFGYTIFFHGLYWILTQLKPDKVSLLGFDHDYNPQKVEKWTANGRPAPHNLYLKPHNQTIVKWADEFFKDMQPDSFYGHGTPDPLRLGEEYIYKKIQFAKLHYEIMGIELVNLSPVQSPINDITKEPLEFTESVLI